MKRMNYVVLIGALVSFPLYAVDIPEVEEGAAKMNQAECVASKANNCIESVCMVSSDVDCNRKCKSAAVDQCEEASE